MTRYLWLASALFIVYGTSLPFHFVADPAFAMDKLSRLPLDVLAPMYARGGLSAPDMVQNVLLFVPFGVFGAIALRGRGRIAAAMMVTISGALLSLFVEGVQLFTVDRSSSVNDVATNTLGACAGALVAPAAAVAARRMLAAARASRVAPTAASFYPVVVSAGLIALAAWHPFDVALNVGGMWSDIRKLATDPLQAGAIGDEGADAVRYALFAAAGATWLRAAGARRPVFWGGVAGTLAACGFEASQILLQSRMPGLKDVLVGTGGAWAGAAAAGSPMRTWRPARLAVVVTAAACCGAAMIAWSPFIWADARRPLGWFPFFGYYRRSTEQAVSHVIEIALAYFPAGYAIAQASVRRNRWMAAAMVVLGLAAPVEYLQGWVVDRVPDVTDVAIAVLGGVVGAWFAGPVRDQFVRELTGAPAVDQVPN